jgi:hypothetical protein
MKTLLFIALLAIVVMPGIITQKNPHLFSKDPKRDSCSISKTESNNANINLSPYNGLKTGSVSNKKFVN